MLLMRKFYFLSAIITLFSSTLTGCTTPGYVCPLKNQVGACSSQIQAYKATLVHEANETSIFEGSLKGVKQQ